MQNKGKLVYDTIYRCPNLNPPPPQNYLYLLNYL